MFEFDTDTDRADMYPGSLCTDIISSSTLGQLASAAPTQCVWTGPKRLLLSWLGSSSFTINQDVRIRAGVLKTADGFSAFSGLLSASLAGPAVTPVPEPTISGPTGIGTVTPAFFPLFLLLLLWVILQVMLRILRILRIL